MPVRLVVLDSVAHPFRDLDVHDGAGAQRSQLLYRVAAQLKALAQTCVCRLRTVLQPSNLRPCSYQLVVVVSNHVVDCMDDAPGGMLEQSTGGAPLRTSGRRVVPALGLHWAHCISTRLFLSRATRPGAMAAEADVSRRLQVVFSPHLAPAAVQLAIRGTGVHGLAACDDDAAEG